MPAEKIKEIWKKEKDLMCGVLFDGRYFVFDDDGGLVLPGVGTDNKQMIFERYEARKKERRFS